jgi:succinate dehydrogenase/fumarate reductase flavoprotein subunit
MEHFTCDVLVLGSGAAGLRAAVAVREAGLDVLVLCHAAPGKSTCTGLSGGVMRGARSSEGPEHLESTLQAGRSINQPDLVQILCAEAPTGLEETRLVKPLCAAPGPVLPRPIGLKEKTRMRGDMS